MASLEEKRKTLNNQKGEILDARVIANYGDPGLDEDYHFDILSRYVVVMIESTDRILTTDKWFRMLAVVKRPQHLWIATEGGVTGPTSQRRADQYGNVNVGLANGYSASAISRMNQPYSLGETIKIRRLPRPLEYTTDNIFQSDFSDWNANVMTYGSWHNEGSTLPYFSGNAGRLAGLVQKTLVPRVVGENTFNFFLTKYQYEAFMFLANVQDTTISNNLKAIFEGGWSGMTMVYSANGGYLFKNNSSVSLSTIEFEDVNFGNKQRVSTNECIPLIVTTPNSFPSPRVRSVGTISYNPTYSTIVKS